MIDKKMQAKILSRFSAGPERGKPVACARCRRQGRFTEAVSLGDNWVECPVCGPFLDLTRINLEAK